MPVTITWDEDTPITGQPDAGTASKVYTAGTAGTVTVADESIGGPSRTLHYTVPLSHTTVVPNPSTVNSAGSVEQRTTTVAGQGFPPGRSGTVAIATGPADAYGTTVVATGATTNASGIFTGVQLTIPAGLDAGGYHIEATFGAIADLSAVLTVNDAELDVPTGLASPSQTATTVDLTWNAVTGAENYVVRWAPAGTGTWTEADPVATTSDTIGGLDPETSYDVEVKATAAGSADSPWSTTLTVATTEQPQLDTPANVATGVPTSTTIPLSWDAVADAETYTIAWRETGGVWTEESGVATTSDTVTGLDPMTEYELRVKAVADGFIDSEWSDVVSATTDSLGQLDAPANLASPTQTATSVSLTWDAVPDATSYGVEWSPAGAGTWTEQGTGSNAITIGGLTASTSYDFRAAARAPGWIDSNWSTTFTQSTTA